MRDFDKTQEQLINELLQMRHRIAEKNQMMVSLSHTASEQKEEYICVASAGE